MPSDKGRAEHWNEFYLNGDIPQFPSPFAEWVSQSLTEKSKIIDIGWGMAVTVFSSIQSGIQWLESMFQKVLSRRITKKLQLRVSVLIGMT